MRSASRRSRLGGRFRFARGRLLFEPLAGALHARIGGRERDSRLQDVARPFEDRAA